MALEPKQQAPQIKVAFRGPVGDVETLWADNLGDDQYRLDNTPWYAYGISWRDIVDTRPDATGQLQFQRVREKSGRRTVRITADAPFHRKYVGIDIPPEIDLATVVAFLTVENVRWEHADPTFEQYYTK